MTFGEKLGKAMQQQGLTQRGLGELIGKSLGSVNQYLSGKQVPPPEVRRGIAVALGLTPDYFEQSTERAPDPDDGKTVARMKVERAAKLLGVHPETLRKGLQQGVFPWGYGVQTSDNRWVYIINAARFFEIERVQAV